MWAEDRRFVGSVDQAVAGLADRLVHAEADPVGHRFVDSNNPVLRVDDGNRVWHGVERLLPIFRRLGDGSMGSNGLVVPRGPLRPGGRLVHFLD